MDASISVFEGMHPTRAQVVPYEPSLINTKLSVCLRTSRSADRPAEPEPMIATSYDLVMSSPSYIRTPHNHNLSNAFKPCASKHSVKLHTRCGRANYRPY